MSDNFFGKRGFIWWKGVVEDRKDPIFLGRVRVRIFGWHTDDKTQLPTGDLPWAMPSLPIDNGKNPVGLKEGDWCWGFFLDDDNAQKPVVVGYMPGINEDAANPDLGFYDPTLNENLTSEEVPRPPRMSPLPDYEAEFLDTVTGGYSPEFLPGGNVAFGELTKDYSADKFKFDLNKDGTYNQDDVDQMLSSDGFFTGEIRTTLFSPEVAMSRYPLEDTLNEPSSSRLARNEKIEETIVALKNAELKSGVSAGYEGGTSDDDSSTGEEKTIKKLSAGESIPEIPFAEPKSPYNAKYPYNHVYESESGHVIEVDDSPGAERLHWYHRSGSFKEIHPNGLEVNKSVNHQYNFVYLDHFTGVGYNYNLEAGENVKMKSGLASMIQAGTTINIQSGESLNISAGSDENRKVGGSANTSVGADAKTVVGGSKKTLISADDTLFVKTHKSVVVGENLNTVAKGVYTKGENVDLFGVQRVLLEAPAIYNSGKAYFDDEVWLNPSLVKLSLNITNPTTPASDLESEKLAEELEDELTAAEGTPKYGYLIPNGLAGDVWKPISEGDGKLVTLSSAGYNHELREAIPTDELEAVVIKHKSPDGTITEWEVVRPVHIVGELIDSPVKVDDFVDGVRKLTRFSKPGAEYPKQLFWVVEGNPMLILDSGYRHQCEQPYDNKINFDVTTIREQNEADNAEEA